MYFPLIHVLSAVEICMSRLVNVMCSTHVSINVVFFPPPLAKPHVVRVNI